MSTPPEQQPHGSPDTSSASMVRVCDRCGTVCSADQEWCLNCGVRMTEAGQGLPGLRAAGLVVALAVLLAGGAAAASYAALRGDARSAANVPGETTTAPPVAQVPATPAPAAPATPAPVTSTPTPAPATTSTAKKTPTPTPVPATPAPSAPATPSTGSSAGTGGSGSGTPSGTGSSSGGSGSGGSSGSGSSTGSGSSGSGSGSGTSTTPSGPIVFASGQGSIYDPGDLVSDDNKGDEGNAIDGSTGTSWKVTLNDGATGGIGYVLDFDTATTVKQLKINTATAGLEIKVLGTTRSNLPPDVNDNRWDTIATDRTLKSGTNTVPLKAVSGASSKYRHVLVVFTMIPGTPASATIREFTASR